MQALAGWHLIIEKFAQQPLTPHVAALAAEDGAMHTHALAAPDGPGWWLEEDDDSRPAELASTCGHRLDQLAATLRLGRNQLFPCAPMRPYDPRIPTSHLC